LSKEGYVLKLEWNHPFEVSAGYLVVQDQGEGDDHIASDDATGNHQGSLADTLPWRVTNSKKDWVLIIFGLRKESSRRRHAGLLRQYEESCKSTLITSALEESEFLKGRRPEYT
jgi:hypothetical protein